MASTQNHEMDDLSRIPPAGCQKVFIPRDYSEGTSCKFQVKFPPELDEKIEKAAFENTVNTLNSMYAEAEKVGPRSYCEGCMACITAYLIYLCMETHYEKCLRQISRYIHKQNETVYVPRGLLLMDPSERGLRVLEIAILSESLTPRS